MRGLCLFALLTCASAHADVVLHPLETGFAAVLEIDGAESLSSLFDKVEDHLGVPPDEQELVLVREESSTDDVEQYLCIARDNRQRQPRYALAEGGAYRDYDVAVTPAEKEIITYIVNMLADSSYAKLLLNKNELDRAGAKIDHLHPLRHLSTVFSDEQLKVNVRNIRRKSKVWKSYTSGLGKSLGEEYAKNNISTANISDFAQAVQVDRGQVTAFVNQQQWKELIEFLADAVPRQGNPRRYDM